MSEVLTEPGAAAAEPAAEPVDPLATGDAAGAATDGTEPVTEPAAAPAEPTFDPNELQAELDHVRGQNEELLGLLTEALNGASPAAPQAGGATSLEQLAAQLTDEYGNPNMAALAEFINAQNQGLLSTIDQRLQQFVEPLQAREAAEREARGEENLKDILADDIARNGEFASNPQADAAARDRVRQRAELMFPEIAARYGDGPRAAEIAMSRAAAEERDYLRAVRGEGAAETANRLATLAGAAADPGVGAAGGVGGVPEFKSPKEVIDYYAGEARRIASAAGQ